MGYQVETRRKLVEAAIQLFASKGYKGTTIRDIAKATGMTLSNTYYHFGSKNGLLVAIISELANKLQAELQQVCASDLQPLERFEELVRTHLGRVALDAKSTALLFYDEGGLTPDANEVIKRVQLSVLNIYRGELQNLQAAGYLRSQNITILAFHILALIEWHIRWYRAEGRLSLDEIKHEALDFILRGILDCKKKEEAE